MFTSHLKQFLNLLEPEFPFVFTNNENTVGKHSAGYKKAKHDLKVVRKIGKFEDILDAPRIYKIFTYDKVTKTYDVIERKVCESLTENFGYDYVNDRIDEIKEGDELVEGEVIYHSTSYDEDMNYGYGRNATVMYTLDPYTSEDAAIISESFSKKMASIEVDEIKIGLNGNDYLIDIPDNLKDVVSAETVSAKTTKDKKGNYEYKPLPDIGEFVSGKLAVSRRQFNNQLLFDFKDKSLHEVHDGDVIFYVNDNVEIIDYTIYNNQDEDADNPFYDQINKYLHSEMVYYRQIKETCEEIMSSGKKYTRDVEYTYKRACHMLDRKKKWKESNDSVFGNMEIEVTIRREVPLGRASKFTG